jgi:hypothetical protein
MSAWRIGRESGSRRLALDDGPAWKKYVDRLVKYIPGDAVGGYTAAITLFLLDDETPDPKLWLALAFTLLSALLVLIGWASEAGHGKFPSVIPDVVLAVIAFVAWSMTVPGNGWQDYALIGDNPGIAGLVGLIAGILMPGIAKLFGRD